MLRYIAKSTKQIKVQNTVAKLCRDNQRPIHIKLKISSLTVFILLTTLTLWVCLDKAFTFFKPHFLCCQLTLKKEKNLELPFKSVLVIYIQNFSLLVTKKVTFQRQMRKFACSSNCQHNGPKFNLSQMRQKLSIALNWLIPNFKEL